MEGDQGDKSGSIGDIESASQGNENLGVLRRGQLVRIIPAGGLMVLMGKIREYPEIIDEEFEPFCPNAPTPKDWVEE